MTKRVLVLTKNPYLGQKLTLELLGKCDVKVQGDVPEELSPFGTVFLDRDTVTAEVPSAVVMSGDESVPRDLPLPLPLGVAQRYLKGRETDTLLLLPEKRCVMFREKTIRLTDAEYLLLSRLISAGGGFVGREELLQNTFSSDSTESALNVYIHYLREKLEFSGEKIILSSRNAGYAIDRKYIGG